MILYSLRCEQAHQFDVWFRDSSAYDQQVADGIVVCPQCGSQKVEKAIMSPRLSKGGGQEAVTEAPEDEAQQAPAENAGVPANSESEGTEGLQQQPPSEAEVRQAFRKLRQYVEANSDYVGSSFAEEARRIHNEEAPERNIYGETTPEEAEELEEEGVPFARVPWVSREDA
ncbi:DUF1178 family protein [Fodinicurvata fenggangensis]|uniref:DUF1178 family protein n=1 Tax=Fodinicurvata fenggangensis TaxID=1121830 RepID=UPI00047A3C33|nr:DUF1178 family protein [Fodinicurvata fenggangensis]